MIHGKGAMIWKLRNWQGGDPKAQAKQCKDLGLDWISVKAMDGTLTRWEPKGIKVQNEDLIRTTTMELAAAGIVICTWGWTYGKQRLFKAGKWIAQGASISAAEARVWITKIRDLVAAGGSPILLEDAETDYRKGGMAQEATRFTATIEAEAPEILQVPCTYRFPLTEQTDFPIREFMRHADATAPQVYWILDDRDDGGAEQLERCVRQYRSVKEVPIVPIGPTYAKEANPRKGWRASKMSLLRFFQKAKDLGLAGVGVWALDTASPDQIEALGEFKWPRRAAKPTSLDERVGELERKVAQIEKRIRAM